MTAQGLQAEGLHVRYGATPALAGVSLRVAPGELVGVVGSQGAGKTTLVNSLAGWSRARPAVSGTVTLAGEDVSTLPAHSRTRRGLLLVPEGKGAFERLTVEENLELAAACRSPGRRFELDEIHALFPILARRRKQRAATLSGGERQMLAISRALRIGPRVLILDEPSIGLAPRLVLELLLKLRELVDVGLPLLLVEQNVRAALEVVDRLYLLEQGRIVGAGDAGTMRDDPRVAEAYLGALQAT